MRPCRRCGSGDDIVSSATTDLVESAVVETAWQLKRALSDRVTNTTVDHCSRPPCARARWAVKLGGGRGGFMLLFVRPDDQNKVRAALGDLITVPFRFEMSGGRIVLYQPNGL